ncbi:MAG TPA: hypothetical protein VGF38_14855 [Ktedonobacterales bacterium]|jgi:hypothetical protein
MSISAFRFSGKRRLITVILAAVALITVIAVVAFNASHTKTAYGAGNGHGAGICSPNSPVCTDKGNSAFAVFDHVSSDGCIFTQVSVQPTTNLSHPGGNDSQSVFVFISKYDQCNDVQLEAGGNSNPTTGADPEFTGTIDFGANLSTGTLTGTAPIYDNTTGDLLFTATINVTWNGYGPTTEEIESDHFHSPGEIMNMHIHGTSRNAEAAGTFTDETGTNVITEPTLNAVMFDSKGSQIIIFRP